MACTIPCIPGYVRWIEAWKCCTETFWPPSDTQTAKYDRFCLPCCIYSWLVHNMVHYGTLTDWRNRILNPAYAHAARGNYAIAIAGYTCNHPTGTYYVFYGYAHAYTKWRPQVSSSGSAHFSARCRYEQSRTSTKLRPTKIPTWYSCPMYKLLAQTVRRYAWEHSPQWVFHCKRRLTAFYYTELSGKVSTQAYVLILVWAKSALRTSVVYSTIMQFSNTPNAFFLALASDRWVGRPWAG